MQGAVKCNQGKCWFDLNFHHNTATNPVFMNHRTALTIVAGVALLGTGCRKEEVTSYRVPKEVAPTTAGAPGSSQAAGADSSGAPMAPGMPPGMAPGMANTPVATASGAALAWGAPAQWTAKSPGSMRKGSYAIKGDGAEADMAITAFPGDVGGELANLNRWRGQIQLPPVAPAEFEAATQHLDRNGLHMTIVDVAGTGADAKRILGAMVPYAGATWFFKLIGPEALVAKEKATFMAFLDTVKPDAPAK